MRMVRYLMILVLAFVTGCSQPADGSGASPTISAAPTSSPGTPQVTASPVVTASPTERPTPSPTQEPPLPIEVARFSQIGSWLSVELTNPNDAVGLVRAEFEMALIDANGGVLQVFGRGGVPGSAVRTIYQMPPGASHAFTISMDPAGPAVETIEFRLLSDWLPWPSNAPTVTVTDAALSRADFGYQSVTGRVSTADPGPFNVWVMAYADAGGQLLVLTGVVNCLRAADGAVGFEVTAFAEVSAPPVLQRVDAVTTTVPGVGSTQRPPGC